MIGESKYECAKNVKTTRKTLETLEFVINLEKSQLNPARQCKFLGFVLDTNEFSIYLPQEKRENIRKAIHTIYDKNTTTIRSVAKTIGVLACSAVSYGWLYTKTLEREKFLALSTNNEDFEKDMRISSNAKRDLNWWAKEYRNG